MYLFGHDIGGHLPSEMESVFDGVVVKGKPSTVVPAKPTGYNIKHSLSNLDISVRLHYIRAVYYFRKPGLEEWIIIKWKEALFHVLNSYPVIAGRLAVEEETGKYYVKCSDNGIRFIEADCSAVLEGQNDMRDCAFEEDLSPMQPLGPDLSISPLLLIQITRFKCGGISVGLAWAHILGDAFSAASFMNAWGEILRGKTLSASPSIKNLFSHPALPRQASSEAYKHYRSKMVEGSDKDIWALDNKNVLGRATFCFNDSKIEDMLLEMQAKAGGLPITPFEMIAALIWGAMAKIRGPEGSKKVTICTDFRAVIDSSGTSPDGSYNFGNHQVFLDIEDEEGGHHDIKDLSYLAMTIHSSIGKRVSLEEINGVVSWLEEERRPWMAMYGSYLTFVNWEYVPCYDVVVTGEKRLLHVSFDVDGVGENGMVLVFPPSSSKTRFVRLVLKAEELIKLEELLHQWSLIL